MEQSCYQVVEQGLFKLYLVFIQARLCIFEEDEFGQSRLDHRRGSRSCGFD